MRTFILPVVLFFLFAHTHLPAQQMYYNQTNPYLKANGVWCFGDSAGLDFSNGGPVPFRQNAVWFNLAGYNSLSSVADPISGELQFYTNGQTFFKANGQPMINGKLNDTSWRTVIVPDINKSGRYYVFAANTSDSVNIRKSNYPSGVFYSVVNMKLDNGSGDVEPAFRNILLDANNPSPIMTAVQSDNCQDVWLLVHGNGLKSLKAFRITPNGIDPVAVTSPLPMDTFPSQIAVSPDRKKIAMIAKKLYIADFDVSTGKIDRVKTIPIDSAGIRRFGLSVCFAPDNSKLYAQIAPEFGSTATPGIYQMSTLPYDSASIARSISFIAATGSILGYMKLYNDTIYVAGGFPPLGAGLFLSRINEPNKPGGACNYQSRAIALAPGTAMVWQPFHNEVVIPLFPDTTVVEMDVLICGQLDLKELELGATNVHEGTDFHWSTGDTSASIFISEEGTYSVTYHDGFCNIVTEHFHVAVAELDATITVSGFALGTIGGPYSSYQWLRDGEPIAGATKSIYLVTQNGSYQVIITNDLGCTDTSDVYRVNNAALQKPVSTDPLRLYPNTTDGAVFVKGTSLVTVSAYTIDGRQVATWEKTQSINLAGLPDGIYLLRVSDPHSQLFHMEKVVKVGTR